MLYVTHRCIAHCGHCFFRNELNQNKTNELTVNEIESLAQSLGSVLQVTLTGGMPEMRRDLPEIVRSFVRHCRPTNISICMGGYDTARILMQIEEILKTCPNQRLNISLSLDALGEEHDRLRGVPSLFENTISTFTGLEKLREVHPQLHLTCSLCVSGLNYGKVEETTEWIRRQLPIDALKIILTRGKPADPRARDTACIQPYLKLIHDEENKPQTPAGDSRRIPLEILEQTKEIMIRDLTREILLTGRSPVRCGASRENVVIYSDGTLGGCELRPEKIGNLRDVGMDISQLWNKQSAQSFRARIKRESCCCYHHAFLSLPVLRSPRIWPRLLKSGILARQSFNQSSKPSIKMAGD